MHMQLREILNDVMIQAEEKGIMVEGDLNIDLDNINPMDTVLVTLAFHVDVLENNGRVPHCEGVRVEVVPEHAVKAVKEMLRAIANEGEDAKPDDGLGGLRPKGWG